jgi:hypothetical protein
MKPVSRQPFVVVQLCANLTKADRDDCFTNPVQVRAQATRTPAFECLAKQSLPMQRARESPTAPRAALQPGYCRQRCACGLVGLTVGAPQNAESSAGYRTLFTSLSCEYLALAGRSGSAAAGLRPPNKKLCRGGMCYGLCRNTGSTLSLPHGGVPADASRSPQLKGPRPRKQRRDAHCELRFKPSS